MARGSSHSERRNRLSSVRPRYLPFGGLRRDVARYLGGLVVEEILASGGVMAPVGTVYDSFFRPTIVERVTYGAFPVVTRIELPPQRPVRDSLVTFTVSRAPIRFYAHNGLAGTYLERLSHSYVHRSGSLEWPVKPDCWCWA